MKRYVKQPKDYALQLIRYRKNVFSQHGEDGITERILDLIGVEGSGWCCEFGAWDGKHLSNTFNLIKNKGWKSVLIELDPVKFRDLEETAKEFPGQILAKNEMVYHSDKGKLLDDILAETPIPKDFDLLSIDVDGPDYHIWKSLKNYRPKIVIIEHSGVDDDIVQREGAVHKVDIDGSTSFHPIKSLGESKGYVLLADTGNLFFLRGDIFENIGANN